MTQINAAQAVTIYEGNRLDQARRVTPHDLAQEFIEAVRAGYFQQPCGRSGEWAYRLWLTAPDGANATWRPDDDDALMNALGELIGSDEPARRALTTAVWGTDE